MQLNLGCGSALIPGWINIDKAPTCDSVTKLDLNNKWPWADGSVELITISHMLYSMTKAQRYHILSACYRVLKLAEGFLRITEDDYACPACKWHNGMPLDATEPLFKSEIKNMLHTVGFMVIQEMDPSETMSDNVMILQHRHANPPATFFVEAAK